MPPHDKDAALLPHRIGKYWALIHRPTVFPAAHIWISYSPDLRHWGSHKLMLEARRGAWRDADKIGLSPLQIETAQGWLILYHGVRQTATGSFYRLGSPFLTCKHLSNACAEVTSGFFAQRNHTNDLATWPMWCSHAAIRLVRTVTRSISTTAGPIAV